MSLKNKNKIDYMTARNSAISVVSNMMYSGKLVRLSKDSVKCVDCGSRAYNYEHRDYGFPEDVDPVCVRCNALRGKAKNSLKKAKQKTKLNCIACQHEWLPRVKEVRQCPKCKSYKWYTLVNEG